MRIDSDNISTEGREVIRVRVDRIGSAGERELWWVALSFRDESTKPEGMFTDRTQALKLAGELAAAWGVKVAMADAAS
ncbi:MAG: hypothetical protein CVT66_02290 [Actinobacteria bacterium HGW-Actinobacteria-6]|nr:MAG: hypothetical protein CVT66_02290 [Actinobacteria bacterium HGW-Actinobacteria-6]